MKFSTEKKVIFPHSGVWLAVDGGGSSANTASKAREQKRKSSWFIYTQYRFGYNCSTMICGSVVRELGIWIESSAPGCIAISYWLTFRRMTFSSFIVWRRKHCHCCDEWKHFHSISRVDSCAFQWKSGWKVKRESSPSLLPPSNSFLRAPHSACAVQVLRLNIFLSYLTVLEEWTG